MYKQIDANKRRTFYMFFIFLLLVIGIGWLLSYAFDAQIILWVAVSIAVIRGWVSYSYSDKIALAVTGAKPADEGRYRELHRIVENLATTGGLPKPRVYVIDDPAPNAFATGRDSKTAAVAVTTGLIETLERSELEGVIAHELAHIGNRDILVMTVAVTLVGAIVLVSDLMLRNWFWGGSRSRNGNQGGGYIILIALILAILAPLFAQLISLAVSRKREYLADATGALLTRYPEGLALALKKIAHYNQPMKRANRATAHLFIDEPFGREEGHGQSWFTTIFSTHPPITDRVKKLMEMS